MSELVDGRYRLKLDPASFSDWQPAALDELVPRLRCPLVAIRGGASLVSDRAVVASMIASAPIGRLVEVQDAGHFLLLSHARQVADEITRLAAQPESRHQSVRPLTTRAAERGVPDALRARRGDAALRDCELEEMIDMAAGVTESVRGFFHLRVPNSEFVNRPWRIHELIDGFRVEDVWALPTPGGPDDLATLVRYAASSENAALKTSPMVNWLFSLRWRLGKLLGWDRERQQVGKRVDSLRDQLPEDLRAQRGPDMKLAPFRSVFLTHNEWAAEFSASMGHIVMHHGWVQGEDGKYYSQMTSLVKPYGVFGKMYMAFIKPFRYLVVYPLQFRVIRRVWPQVLREWS